MSDIIYKCAIILTKDGSYKFVQYKGTEDELYKKYDIIKIFDSDKSYQEYRIMKEITEDR